jgi:hypothetical protein
MKWSYRHEGADFSEEFHPGLVSKISSPAGDMSHGCLLRVQRADAKTLGLSAQWSFWAMLVMEGLLLDLLNHRAILPEFARDPSHAERDELLLQKPLTLLNKSLSGRGHLTGENFTVADLNVASILAWGKMARLNLSDFSELSRYDQHTPTLPHWMTAGTMECIVPSLIWINGKWSWELEPLERSLRLWTIFEETLTSLIFGFWRFIDQIGAAVLRCQFRQLVPALSHVH